MPRDLRVAIVAGAAMCLLTSDDLAQTPDDIINRNKWILKSNPVRPVVIPPSPPPAGRQLP